MKPIPGYPGYFATDSGTIVSRIRKEVTTELKPYKRNGYLLVHVSVDGKQFMRFVHRLVAWAYFSSPLPDQEIRHLDGCRVNNLPSNLAWGTKKENVDDKRRHGTIKSRSSHPRTKFTEDQVTEIKRALKAGARHALLADKYSVSRSTISMISNGTNWPDKHGE